MDLVGIHDAPSKLGAYPFELSGGLRQARDDRCGRRRKATPSSSATSRRPLWDVTVQAQILALFTHLRDELDAALLYVTHDLAVVAQLCDSLTVLYSGKVMESRQDLRAALADPRHPYTRALLQSTPDIDRIEQRLRTIPGSAPSHVGPARRLSFRAAAAEPRGGRLPKRSRAPDVSTAARGRGPLADRPWLWGPRRPQ